MKLFDIKNRDCTQKERKNQSIYDFFDNSSLPEHERIRDFLNNALNLYDEQSQIRIIDDIIKNKNSDEKFYSTCFELIVSYIFRQIGGYTLEPHPKLPNSDKRPDFLVRTPNGDSFYLELVTIGELNNSQLHIIKNYVEKFKNTLNEKQETVISIKDIEGRKLSHGDVQELIKDIPKWWNNNKQNVGEKLTKSFHESSICLEIVIKDSLRLESTIDQTEFHNKLLDSLEKKARRYGELDLPFMIATTFRPSVFSIGLFLQDELIAASIYGGNIFNFKKQKCEDNSFWATFKQQKRNNHVGGILYFDSLIPENLEHFGYVMFLNHYANDDKRLPEDLKEFLSYYYVIDEENATINLKEPRRGRGVIAIGKLSQISSS